MFKVTQLVLILVFSQAALALDYNPHKRLSAEIGHNVLNKITVAGDELAEVVGNDAFYAIKSDSAGNVYITPSLEGDIILTVVTASGRSQDLRLVVKKDAAHVSINFPKMRQAKLESHGEIVNLIRNLSELPITNQALWIKEQADLKITALVQRSFGEYKGVRGLISSKKPYTIDEKHLASILEMGNIAAISVSAGKLTAGSEAEIYIIWR